MHDKNNQDRNNNQDENWEKVATAFKAQYSPEIYDEVLGKCRLGVSKSGKIALIGAPIRFIKDRIDKEYIKTLFLFWKAINPSIEKLDVFVGRINTYQESEEEGLEPQSAEIIELPLWPETTRGTPNAILRTSLFAAITPNKRQAFKRAIIAEEKDLKITFTGWQLDQSDRDVFEQALHMAREQPLGTEIYFTARGFLKALGRSTGKSQHEWLKDSFARLLGCGVEITHNNYTYADNLLGFERDEETQRYKMSIKPKMMQLYTAGWTQSDFKERQMIGSKKYLAQWLHGYIATHAQLYPMKIETFHRLSGSTNSEIRGFKRRLISALDHLKALDLIKDFYLKNNLVYIEKYPSNSQKRHLMKKDPRLKKFLTEKS